MEKDSKNGSQEQTDSVEVRSGRLQSLDLHAVMEHELQFFAEDPPEDPPDSNNYTIAFFMLSAFLSFLSVLLTNPPPSGSISLIVYIAITVGTGLAGGILFIMAYASRRQTRRQRSRVLEQRSQQRSRIVKDVKDRLPPVKPVQQAPEQDGGQQVNLPPKSF